jgi:hypothetical protein
VKAECHGLIARYPGKDCQFLVEHFNFTEFYQRYGRVKDFDPRSDVKDWTFWTYARRASKVFGPRGIKIAKQLKNQRLVVRRRVRLTLSKMLASPQTS